MNLNKVAIIVHEDESLIKALSKEMHLWVAATEKNKITVESLWALGIVKGLDFSHYDIPVGSSPEDWCVIAIDLVESHHSSVFGADPWLEIQVHGCELTERLLFEFNEFGNTKIQTQPYGFNVTRPGEITDNT